MDFSRYKGLFTPVEIPRSNFRIGYGDKLAFIGSCFAQNISQKFEDAKFNILANPFGTLYNPLSIQRMIEVISTSRMYTEEDLFLDSGWWTCWDTHSSLARKDKQGCLDNLNGIITSARKFLAGVKVVFITLGSAYVYFLKETGKVVSNCHRQSQELFERKLITVTQAANSLKETIALLKSINSNIQVVFTVSPLRHLKDGIHENNLSKSTLILAIDQVTKEVPETASYFPSYEIVMDELRDYRFYAEDKIHLTDQAESFIFEQLKQTYIENGLLEKMKDVENFMKIVHHRIVDPKSEKINDFVQMQLARAQLLMEQIPGLDLSEEMKYFEKLQDQNP